MSATTTRTMLRGAVRPIPAFLRAVDPPIAARPDISAHFAPFVAQALVLASATSDMPSIDEITDALVVDGLVRPRWDCTLLDQLRARAGRRT